MTAIPIGAAYLHQAVNKVLQSGGWHVLLYLSFGRVSPPSFRGWPSSGAPHLFTI